MDHLFLLQFACFLFMLFNAFTLAVPVSRRDGSIRAMSAHDG